MDRDNIWREAARLVCARRWLALATVDPSGAPSISYAPFAPVDGAFGIVVSRLAAHTANLFVRPSASVLLIDDVEQEDPYAQARFSVRVTARRNAPESAEANAVWWRLEARNGVTVRTLRQLPDFDAFSLEPLGGRLVLGFASAHTLRAAAIAEMLRSG